MDQKNDFEEAKDGFFKLLPVIPILLTVSGASKLFLHYKKFNINIFHYIEINEIITLFISDLYYFVFSVSSFAIFNALYYSLNFNMSIDFIQRPKPDDKLWIKFLKGLLRMGVLIAYLAFFLNLLSTSKNNYWKLFYMISVFIIAILISVRSYQLGNEFIKGTFNKSTAYVYRFYLFVSIGITLFAFNSSINDFYLDHPGEYSKYIGSVIKTEKQIFDINGKYILLGRTKNYVFIHSKEDDCTEIIPTSQVQDFSLKSSEN